MSFDFDFNVDQVRQLVPRALGGPEWWFNEMQEAFPKYEIVTVPCCFFYSTMCS